MLNIGPQYYSHIYFSIVAVLSLIVFIRYSSYSNIRLLTHSRSFSVGLIVLTLLLVAFIGLRPISGKYFVDMSSYSAHYAFYSGETFSFDWNTDNIIFDNLFIYFASKGIPVEVFFVIIAGIYFGGVAWACSSLFPKDKMAALLVYLGAFSTFAYATNGIKAGAAASLFLMALAFNEKKQHIWTIVFLLLSLGFHHSMVVPVVAFIICSLVKNPKMYFAFWAFCFLVALLKITYFQELFAGLTDEQGALYLAGEGEHVRNDILGGFRIDFILYSLAPMLLGGIALFRKKVISKNYVFLLNLYIFTNAIWLLCMYAEFTNRIAYLSWLMLPVVLIYPLLKENYGKRQYQVFQWVALGHLAFTLFMNYIIY